MPELSLNILDVTENSIKADADEIIISISVDTKNEVKVDEGSFRSQENTLEDTLTIRIIDNGKGMTSEQLEKVQDPFYTTRTTRKVGLGVPFLKQAAESTGGIFKIDSEVGRGTVVEAIFMLSHIDRMPLGDITATIHTLVVFNERIRFKYTYGVNESEFTLDTKEFREILGEEVSFQEPEISKFIKEYLETNKQEVDGGVII